MTTICWCPALTASWSGVLFSAPGTLGTAPLVKSRSTMSVCPFWAASCNGVQPEVEETHLHQVMHLLEISLTSKVLSVWRGSFIQQPSHHFSLALQNTSNMLSFETTLFFFYLDARRMQLRFSFTILFVDVFQFLALCSRIRTRGIWPGHGLGVFFGLASSFASSLVLWPFVVTGMMQRHGRRAFRLPWSSSWFLWRLIIGLWHKSRWARDTKARQGGLHLVKGLPSLQASSIRVNVTGFICDKELMTWCLLRHISPALLETWQPWTGQGPMAFDPGAQEEQSECPQTLSRVKRPRQDLQEVESHRRSKTCCCLNLVGAEAEAVSTSALDGTWLHLEHAINADSSSNLGKYVEKSTSSIKCSIFCRFLKCFRFPVKMKCCCQGCQGVENLI